MILRKLFSKKDSKKKHDKKARNAFITAGGTLVLTDGVIGPIQRRKFYKKENNQEGTELYEKLKNKFKESGGIINEGVIQSDGNKKIDSTGGAFETLHGKQIGKGRIDVHTGDIGKADILSHELGHIHYFDKNSKKSIGKLAHSRLSDIVSGNSGLAAFGVGLAAGKKSVDKENKGEEPSKLGRVSGGLVGSVLDIPRLAAEHEASRKGYELLKNAGASEKYLKKAKKTHSKALGTYILANTTGNIIANELGYGTGRIIGNKLNKNKKNKED